MLRRVRRALISGPAHCLEDDRSIAECDTSNGESNKGREDGPSRQHLHQGTATRWPKQLRQAVLQPKTSGSEKRCLLQTISIES